MYKLNRWCKVPTLDHTLTFRFTWKEHWQMLHIVFFLLQWIANDSRIMAGNLGCSSTQWVITWICFYNTQSQFQFQGTLKEPRPSVFFFSPVNTAGPVTTQNSAMHCAQQHVHSWQLRRKARARSMAANTDSRCRSLLVVYIKTKLLLLSRGAPSCIQLHGVHFITGFKYSKTSLKEHLRQMLSQHWWLK